MFIAAAGQFLAESWHGIAPGAHFWAPGYVSVHVLLALCYTWSDAVFIAADGQFLAAEGARYLSCSGGKF